MIKPHVCENKSSNYSKANKTVGYKFPYNDNNINNIYLINQKFSLVFDQIILVGRQKFLINQKHTKKKFVSTNSKYKFKKNKKNIYKTA